MNLSQSALSKNVDANELANLLRERGRGLGGVRTELVARVREQIAAGTYDTPERWEAALDRLADALLA